MVDLKLLCPCPRWKLVVDLNPSLGAGSESDVTASALASPPVPPSLTTTRCGTLPSSSQVTCSSSSVTRHRAMSRGIGSLNSSFNSQNSAHATNGNTAHLVAKHQLTESLLALLASNMPSDIHSPLVGEQVNGITFLRLLLLCDTRAPEEEELVDTVLVLYNSCLCAGRSEGGIVATVARNFASHAGHIRGLAVRCHVNDGSADINHQGQTTTPNVRQQSLPHSINTVPQPGMTHCQDPVQLMGNGPLIAAQAPLSMVCGQLVNPVDPNVEGQAPSSSTNNNHQLMNPLGN
jgi:hypothetical protein